MKRVVYPPFPSLAAYIKPIEILSSANFEAEGVSTQYLPDGYFELGFNIGGGEMQFKSVKDPSIYLKNPNGYFLGQSTSSVYLRPKGQFKLLMVKIYPWMASCFTGEPLGELANELSDGKLVFKRKMEELEEKLFLAANDAQCVLFVQHFLLKNLQRSYKKQHPLLEAVSLKLFQMEGRVHIDALAKEFSTSPRTIQRLFKLAYGMTPKQLAQQLRLRRFARLYALNPTISFTELALQCGYFDQAHFIHDFQTVAQTTPGQYFKGTPMLADFLQKKEVQLQNLFL